MCRASASSLLHVAVQVAQAIVSAAGEIRRPLLADGVAVAALWKSTSAKESAENWAPYMIQCLRVLPCRTHQKSVVFLHALLSFAAH